MKILTTNFQINSKFVFQHIMADSMNNVKMREMAKESQAQEEDLDVSSEKLCPLQTELTAKINKSGLTIDVKNSIQKILEDAIDGDSNTGAHSFAEIQNNDYEGDSAFDGSVETYKLNAKEFAKYKRTLDQFINALIIDPSESYLKKYQNTNEARTEAREFLSSANWSINLLKKGVKLSEIKARIGLVNNIEKKIKHLDNGLGNDNMANQEKENLKPILEKIKAGHGAEYFNYTVTTDFQQWDDEETPNYYQWNAPDKLSVDQYLSRISNDYTLVLNSGFTPNNKAKQETDNNVEQTEHITKSKQELLNLYTHFQQFFSESDRNKYIVQYNEVEAAFKTNDIQDISIKLMALFNTREKLRAIEVNAIDLYTNSNDKNAKTKVEIAHVKLLRAMKKYDAAGETMANDIHKEATERLATQKEKLDFFNTTVDKAAGTSKVKAQKKYSKLMNHLPTTSPYRMKLLSPEGRAQAIATFESNIIAKEASSALIDKFYTGGDDPSLGKDFPTYGPMFADMEGLGTNWTEWSDANVEMTQELAIMAASMIVTSFAGGAVIGSFRLIASLANAAKNTGAALKTFKNTAGFINRFKKAKQAYKTAKTTKRVQNTGSTLSNMTKGAFTSNKTVNNILTTADNALAFTAIDQGLRELGIFKENQNDKSFFDSLGDNLVLFGALGISSKLMGKIIKQFPKWAKLADKKVLINAVSYAGADVAALSVLHLAESGKLPGGEQLAQDILFSFLFRTTSKGMEMRKRVKIAKERYPKTFEKAANTAEGKRILKETVSSDGTRATLTDPLVGKRKRMKDVVNDHINKSKQNKGEVINVEPVENTSKSQKNNEKKKSTKTTENNNDSYAEGLKKAQQYSESIAKEVSNPNKVVEINSKSGKSREIINMTTNKAGISEVTFKDVNGQIRKGLLILNENGEGTLRFSHAEGRITTSFVRSITFKNKPTQVKTKPKSNLNNSESLNTKNNKFESQLKDALAKNPTKENPVFIDIAVEGFNKLKKLKITKIATNKSGEIVRINASPDGSIPYRFKVVKENGKIMLKANNNPSRNTGSTKGEKTKIEWTLKPEPKYEVAIRQPGDLVTQPKYEVAVPPFYPPAVVTPSQKIGQKMNPIPNKPVVIPHGHIENNEKPEETERQLKEALSALAGITFEHNSSALTSAAKETIKKHAPTLKKYFQQNPDKFVMIAGHTDATGRAAYNQSLSEKRSTSALNALLSEGVDTKNVKSIGLGEQYLTEATYKRSSANKRTDFILSDKISDHNNISSYYTDNKDKYFNEKSLRNSKN